MSSGIYLVSSTSNNISHLNLVVVASTPEEAKELHFEMNFPWQGGWGDTNEQRERQERQEQRKRLRYFQNLTVERIGDANQENQFSRVIHN